MSQYESYTVSAKAAREADNTFSRITSSGGYFGKITRAEQILSSQKTRGVELSFTANDGSQADFITVWTHNSEGKELFGLKQLHALMVCASVRTVTIKDMEIEKYDMNEKKRVKKVVPILVELMGKEIGLMLQREEYWKTAGGKGAKLSLFGVFNKEGFVASEIIDRATVPTKKDKMLATLHDKLVSESAAPGPSAPPRNSGIGGGFDDMSDEIPF